MALTSNWGIFIRHFWGEYVRHRQRVALARALAIKPKLLLLDQPFGALDAKVRKDLRRRLWDLHRQMGLTSIFVTHDQQEMLELADRVAVMDHGRIDQAGTPEQVYMEPARPFVSRFVARSRRRGAKTYSQAGVLP